MTRKRPRGFDSHYGSFREQHTQCHHHSHPPYQEQYPHTSRFHYNLIPPPSREQYRPPPSHTHSAFAAAPEYYYEEGRVSELNDPCVVSGGDGEKVVKEEPGKDPCVVSSFKDERKKVHARKIQKTKEVKPNEVEKFDEAEKNQNGEGPYGITCQRLFMQLQQAMQDREREVKKREDKLDAALANVENQKKATEAERTWIETTRKELADLREHIEIERLKMEEQAKEARAERELIERINTDIAVQTAEMKRTRREVEKNLSELHASKDELNKRRKELGMQELVLPAIKHEMGKQSMYVWIESIHANKDQVEAKERHLVEKPKVIKCENEELRHARLATSIETSEMSMRYEGKPLNSKKVSGKSNQIPIQIALQEDAPELFQVLEEKGLLDEMKDVCSVWDDTWESSGNCEDDFKSLAWVVNKVWGAAMLLPKESRSRLQNLTGGNKVAYCLSCLVTLTNEQFMVPEMLFQPADLGMEEAGLAECIVRAISNCHPDLHPLLYSSIVLTGGNTLFPYFKEKLELELRPLVPDEYDITIQRTDSPITAAWKGASLFAAGPDYDNCAVLKKEYEEQGSYRCRRRFMH